MAKYEDPNQLDYRNGGDTVDDFAQKYMRTIAYVFKALNDLRTPTGNTAGVEPEPYMWRIADNKLYIRNGDNTDYVLLGEISPNFGFRSSVNDRFLTTADLEGDGAVVTRNEAGKVEGDITGSPGKIANKTIDVTPSADNDVIAYDAAQQKWVKKTLNDYLKKQGDAGWDEMVDEVADQVIEDITPIIFNFWYLDEAGYLVPLVGSTEGGLPSIHGMVGDYEQITARSVDVAGNVSATGNVTAGMLTTPQANVTVLTANAVNAGTVTADDVIAKGPVVDVRAFGAKGDGVTDDTQAIQSAINSGHNIYIPSGQYNIGALTFRNNLNISGAGDSQILLQSNVDMSAKNISVKDVDFDLNGYRLLVTNESENEDTISSHTVNTVTITNASSYAVGDWVRLTSATYLWLNYCTSITAIENNTITLGETIPIAGVFGTIRKLPKTDIKLFNSNFRNGTLYMSPSVNGAIIENCDCTSSYISVNGTHVKLSNCNNFTGMALYMATHSEVFSCKTQNSTGIRCVAISHCVIENNEIIDGSNKQYGLGIEINGCDNGAGFVVGDTTYVSGIYNKIVNNKIINANKGVAGSAIGGIHLNWGTHDNLIDGNTCNENGIGIYLENNCCNNIISNNTCNYNNDYYGVGIELDWDCNYNIISNNICNYNAGSVTADESCGIEIRGSRSSSHVCQLNKIINNICRNNGRCGVIDNGIASIISENHITENGSNAGYSSIGQILIYGANDTDISNNIVMGKNPLLGYTDSTYLPSNMVISCNKFFGDDTGDDIIFDALMTSTITNNIVNKGITINSNSGNRNITIINNFSQNYGAIKIEGVNGYKCLYNYKNDGAMAVVATGSTEY